MKKTLKKGFTIVELVIVIAVIAILTAVLVPTISSVVKKANVSADTQLVRNLNTALKEDEALNGSPKTMQGALDVAAADGYDIAKINAKAKDNKILWDSVNNVFVYLKDGKIEYTPDVLSKKDTEDYDFWIIANAINTKYSTYYTGSLKEVTVSTGFDAGEIKDITSITYKTAATQDVVIRANGDQGVLTVNAANSNVDFYGFAKEIKVDDVYGESLHVYGATRKLSVTKGHVKVEDTGIVFELAALAETGSVTNSGYIATKAAAVTKEIAGTDTTGGNYQINSLARLEAFRDVVNAGESFKGKEVDLTADITLKDGWTPIGEGSRGVAYVGSNTVATLFEGTFNGNNKTISNLNNNGFSANPDRIDSEGGCAYGLFALAGNGATIKNLKLTNVNIDLMGSIKGDSVAALVGYAEGDLTISNITVSGAIKATDAVAGIVGRVYDVSGTGSTIAISDCTNNAKLTVTAQGGKTAGIIAIVSNRAKNRATTLTVTSCSNTESISGTNTTESYAAPIVAYATDKGGASYTLTDCSNSGTISAQTSVSDASAYAHTGA